MNHPFNVQHLDTGKSEFTSDVSASDAFVSILCVFCRLVRFDPLGHYLLTAIVNPSNQQVILFAGNVVVLTQDATNI